MTDEALQIIDYSKEQLDLLSNYCYLNTIAGKGQILFTGSSLMEQFPIVELASTYHLDKMVYNRGIGGFTSSQFLENIKVMALDLEPGTIFINIGTNDIKEEHNKKSWQETLLVNYRAILNQIKEQLPQTNVYLMAYYPMDESHPILKHWQGFSRTNAKINEANNIVAKLAEELNYHYINVNEGLTDEKGNLYRDFTKDGIHLFAAAYDIVYRNIEKYLK